MLVTEVRHVSSLESRDGSQSAFIEERYALGVTLRYGLEARHLRTEVERLRAAGAVLITSALIGRIAQRVAPAPSHHRRA